MSKTVEQIYISNPTTTVDDDDLYYLVQSPYTSGNDAAISGASLKAAFNSGTINSGLQNQIAYYSSNGTTLSGLTTLAGGVLVTNNSSVPSMLTNPAANNRMLLSANAAIPAWSAYSMAAPSTSGNVLTSDGTNWTSAALPASGVSVSQLQNGTYIFGVSFGGANTLAISLASAPAAYAEGQMFVIRANNTNTGTATLDVNGLGAKGIYTYGGNPLFGGEIQGGSTFLFEYSGSISAFYLLNPQVLSGNFVTDLCNCRLTLTSGTPITTSDVTAATSIYIAPFRGNQISLYDSSYVRWIQRSFFEITVSVPATTNTIYDVFVYDNAGTVTAETVAWTNDTTRATALVLQNGVYVKSGATSRRYLGSFRTTGSSGQTEDSLAKRYVYNYYNRVSRPGKVVESTTTWNYSTNSFQQSNANAANQLDFLQGVSEDNIYINATSEVTSSLVTARQCIVGIGIDSTSANSATKFTGTLVTNITAFILSAEYNGIPTVGRHYYPWLEKGGGSDTQTWSGTTALGTASTTQTGIIGWMMG